MQSLSIYINTPHTHVYDIIYFDAVAGAVVGFGEIDRSVREDDQINIFVDLFLPSTDNITLRVFPVTLDEFERSHASSFVVSQEVQERIDEITDPAECKKCMYIHCTQCKISRLKIIVGSLNYKSAVYKNDKYQHSPIFTDDPSPGGRRDFNNISLEITFMAGSSDVSKSLATDNLIINDDITEANEAFLLLMEIVDSGSEVVEFESLGGVLIFNIIDDDGELRAK